MNVFDKLEQVTDAYKGAVVVIGNFDGIHQGHQYLLTHARKIAKERNVNLLVLTFHPHPFIFLNPDRAGFRISPRAIKAERLHQQGADAVLVHPFNNAVAELSPNDFVRIILSEGLQACHVVVGEDFGFGHKRQGNVETLETLGHMYGFDVSALPKLTDDVHAIYGSSRIRAALSQGDMKVAHDLMGDWWEIEADIIKGDQRGRTLGYPTANMKLGDLQKPAFGVYACMAGVPNPRQCRLDHEAFVKQEHDISYLETADFAWYPAVANFGVRPMFEMRTPLLEVHLFGFDEDIYGVRLRVKFIEFLRGEMNFDSLESLVEQMDKDSAQTRAVLSRV